MVNQLEADEPEVFVEIDKRSPAQGAEDAHEWFDEDCDMRQTSSDIEDIIGACLKAVKKIRTSRAFKIFTQLTAVTQFVKLRERYHQNPQCKHPGLNASLAIAWRVEKDQYHARQIRVNEQYLLQHHRLPPGKREQFHGQYTLLDNQSVLLGVRRYLAAQALGTITT
jgi:hypothetical protein